MSILLWPSRNKYLYINQTDQTTLWSRAESLTTTALMRSESGMFMRCGMCHHNWTADRNGCVTSLFGFLIRHSSSDCDYVDKARDQWRSDEGVMLLVNYFIISVFCIYRISKSGYSSAQIYPPGSGGSTFAWSTHTKFSSKNHCGWQEIICLFDIWRNHYLTLTFCISSSSLTA